MTIDQTKFRAGDGSGGGGVSPPLSAIFHKAADLTEADGWDFTDALTIAINRPGPYDPVLYARARNTLCRRIGIRHLVTTMTRSQRVQYLRQAAADERKKEATNG